MVTCECGHLDDFPWLEFVHRGPTDCNGPLRLFEFSEVELQEMRLGQPLAELPVPRAEEVSVFDGDGWQDISAALVDEARRRHSGVHFEIWPALGESDAVLDGITRAYAALWKRSGA